jgi:hypothetical protein
MFVAPPRSLARGMGQIRNTGFFLNSPFKKVAPPLIIVEFFNFNCSKRVPKEAQFCAYFIKSLKHKFFGKVSSLFA